MVRTPRMRRAIAACAVLVGGAALAGCASSAASSVTEVRAPVVPISAAVPTTPASSGTAAIATEPALPATTESATTEPATTEPATTESATTTTIAARPATTTTARPKSTTTAPATTTTDVTTTPSAPATGGTGTFHYVYPFVGKHTSYGTTHHDYPAADVFGCGATVVAPIDANVLQIRTVDLWDPATNNPAHRGGKYVSLLGDDGVRYYFAHLASVAVQPGQRVAAGGSLGIMGQTGDARLSACHTHVGISWPCPGLEWQVRRGEIWPQKFLDAWKRGDELSPVDAIRTAQAKSPGACDTAVAAPHAAES